MRLRSVSFTEFERRDQEWRLDGLTLGPINLLVGKNAAGKSRALNVISGLANHLAGLLPPGLSGLYDVHFDHEGQNLHYQLRYEETEVLEERFSVDSRVMLERGTGGEGKIGQSR